VRAGAGKQASHAPQSNRAAGLRSTNARTSDVLPMPASAPIKTMLPLWAVSAHHPESCERLESRSSSSTISAAARVVSAAWRAAPR
jgi:hypothetical protein